MYRLVIGQIGRQIDRRLYRQVYELIDVKFMNKNINKDRQIVKQIDRQLVSWILSLYSEIILKYVYFNYIGEIVVTLPNDGSEIHEVMLTVL